MSADLTADPTADAGAAALDEVTEVGGEVALPTFEVLARFFQAAPDEQAAVDAVRAQVVDARGLYDDVLVERREPDGTWAVLVRFVVVSVDSGTAVRGVHEVLHEAGLPVDEVWADHRYA